ncbi:Uncharacterised protein [Vibrio cholerae]|nr:Uncharacterised protein [Vibrio cholerae]
MVSACGFPNLTHHPMNNQKRLLRFVVHLQSS